jgi:ABC-type antimicrobial peptide transport system permease subunit
MRLVFSSGVRPVVAGTVVGTGVAFLFSLAVVNVMREAPLPLSSTGLVPYVAVAACLITAALLAMVGHARRAARIHPLTALREQ